MNTKFDPRFYVYFAKGLRDFADGFVTIVLPAYLLALDFGVGEIGLIATAALLGSAMITLGVGYFGAHIDSRKLLISACLLMAATGVALASAHSFAWLLVLLFSEPSILMWAMHVKTHPKMIPHHKLSNAL